MNAEEAIAAVLAIVDNMSERRSDLMEESVKEVDRKLSVVRQQFKDEMDLEKKLAILKDQRALERIRSERRNRMFQLIDDGAMYANDPLQIHEIEALVKPLRAFATPNAAFSRPAARDAS